MTLTDFENKRKIITVNLPNQEEQMSRSRDYTRNQRERVIKRKKRICKDSHQNLDWYKYDGQYSKGKIHCSCGMCRCRDHKGGHLITRSVIIAIEHLSEELKSY